MSDRKRFKPSSPPRASRLRNPQDVPGYWANGLPRFPLLPSHPWHDRLLAYYHVLAERLRGKHYKSAPREAARRVQSLARGVAMAEWRDVPYRETRPWYLRPQDETRLRELVETLLHPKVLRDLDGRVVSVFISEIERLLEAREMGIVLVPRPYSKHKARLFHAPLSVGWSRGPMPRDRKLLRRMNSWVDAKEVGLDVWLAERRCGVGAIARRRQKASRSVAGGSCDPGGVGSCDRGDTACGSGGDFEEGCDAGGGSPCASQGFGDSGP
jgi:hypothetical protein